MVKCEIKFDNNPNGIFFAGQTLSGVVELTIDKPKKIRGLILKIEGFAKVQWSETERRHNNGHGVHGNRHGVHGVHGNRHGVHATNHAQHNKTVHYNGREDYLNTISYLMGSSEGNQIEIAPGTYQYNFQALLPALLPTSFEAKHGSIRYLITVVIDRPWKFDLTYKVAFTVLKQLDLNYENPALKIPTKMEIVDTFYCGFCKTAPLFLAASIPMSGYVSGQSINVSVEINNESRIDVEDIKITLKKIILYNSQTPRTNTKEEILNEAEIRCGGVQKRNKTKFDQKLVIPAVPPSNLNYCRVLNVSYEIQVQAKISGLHKNPIIKLPITIGTVPLNIQIPQIHFPSAPSHTPSPTGQYSFADAINGYPNGQPFAPPSYCEAMGSAIQLNEEGEHPIGSQPFHPMYPVYNFNQTLVTPNGSSAQSNPAYVFGSTSSAVGQLAGTPGSISQDGIIQKY